MLYQTWQVAGLKNTQRKHIWLSWNLAKTIISINWNKSTSFSKALISDQKQKGESLLYQPSEGMTRKIYFAKWRNQGKSLYPDKKEKIQLGFYFFFI